MVMVAKNMQSNKAKVAVYLRIDEELHRALITKAQEDDRSVNSMIAILLRAQLMQGAQKQASKPMTPEEKALSVPAVHSTPVIQATGEHHRLYAMCEEARLSVGKWVTAAYDEEEYVWMFNVRTGDQGQIFGAQDLEEYIARQK